MARRLAQSATRDITPTALRSSQGRALQRLLKLTLPNFLGGAGGEDEDAETRVSAGLATPEEADLLARAREAEAELTPTARRGRRRGPATLYERNQRLETAVNVLAGRGRVEYRANTIAVIKDPGIITRIIRWVMAMILIPPHLFAQFMAWVLRPRGKGRLKRRVVFVDRRGNIVVFRA